MSFFLHTYLCFTEEGREGQAGVFVHLRGSSGGVPGPERQPGGFRSAEAEQVSSFCLWDGLCAPAAGLTHSLMNIASHLCSLLSAFRLTFIYFTRFLFEELKFKEIFFNTKCFPLSFWGLMNLQFFQWGILLNINTDQNTGYNFWHIKRTQYYKVHSHQPLWPEAPTFTTAIFLSVKLYCSSLQYKAVGGSGLTPWIITVQYRLIKNVTVTSDALLYVFVSHFIFVLRLKFPKSNIEGKHERFGRVSKSALN